MTKTDYSKVEKALQTTAAARIKQKIYEDVTAKLAELDGKESHKQSFTEQTIQKVQKRIKQDLTRLAMRTREKILSQLSIDREQIKQFISNPSDVTPEQWELIKKVQRQIEHLRKENGNVDQEYNEELVLQERINHVTKRHNVKDGWLPLDTKSANSDPFRRY